MSEQASTATARDARTMSAVRLHAAGEVDSLSLDQLEIGQPSPGEALVEVHAAAITRDELDWPADRLPAIPSSELSGTVVALGAESPELQVGQDVWALTPFDRDGVAAEYALVPVSALAPKPVTLGHVECASIPMGGLTAWQGLFTHGRLREGERVLIHGEWGGVGQFATQLARWCGAHVIATASCAGVEDARTLGADEVIDRKTDRFDETAREIDLVFDTVGGDVLARSGAVLSESGRVVSVAEEPSADLAARFEATYFVVEPDQEQLLELGRLVDAGVLRTLVDSVYPLGEAREAFARVLQPGKRGKVVLRVAGWVAQELSNDLI